MSSSLGPAGYVLLGSRIIRLYLQDLTDLNIFDLFFGLGNGNVAI